MLQFAKTLRYKATKLLDDIDTYGNCKDCLRALLPRVVDVSFIQFYHIKDF